MTFPTEWKNKSHVPNHQPDIVVVAEVAVVMNSCVVIVINHYVLLLLIPVLLFVVVLVVVVFPFFCGPGNPYLATKGWASAASTNNWSHVVVLI